MPKTPFECLVISSNKSDEPFSVANTNLKLIAVQISMFISTSNAEQFTDCWSFPFRYYVKYEVQPWWPSWMTDRHQCDNSFGGIYQRSSHKVSINYSKQFLRRCMTQSEVSMAPCNQVWSSIGITVPTRNHELARNITAKVGFNPFRAF